MASAAKKAKCDSAVDEVISTVRRSYFGKPVNEEFLNFLKSLLENKMAASEGSMASAAKKAKYDSFVDEVISTVRRSYFGKPVDDEYLNFLKSLLENKMAASEGVIKPATIPSVTSILKTEFGCLPFPNEILLKIFEYLDIKDIGRSAMVSRQFNKISNDPSLWKSMGKLCFGGRVPTEFLTYIIQRGITELGLFQCVILPPKVPGVKLTKPLNLKTIYLDNPMGDKTLLHEILTSHPLENVKLTECGPDISHFIKSLPQIGSKLKSFNLCGIQWGILDGLASSLIVNNCLDLEELNIFWDRTITTEAIAYLCENLTTNILKLKIRQDGPRDKGLNDNNIRALVKRCPKLKVLDIRNTEKITYHGLVAISDGLHFLEYLGLPSSVGNELGLLGTRWINGVEKILPYTINLPKMDALKSMRTLKELLIGYNSYSNEYQSILKSEIPQLRINVSNGFEVAWTNKEDFRAIRI